MDDCRSAVPVCLVASSQSVAAQRATKLRYAALCHVHRRPSSVPPAFGRHQLALEESKTIDLGER
uniref:Uncharacterized protein n=1 Tax=Arundo donax TaxID=35708 RepID=A0A0A8YY05_ARUDO